MDGRMVTLSPADHSVSLLSFPRCGPGNSAPRPFTTINHGTTAR